MIRIKLFVLLLLISAFAFAAPADGTAFMVANYDSSQVKWVAQNSNVFDQPGDANPLNSLSIYTFFDNNIQPNTNYQITFSGVQNFGVCKVTYNTQGIVSILNYVGIFQCEQIDAWHMAIL